MNTKTAAAANLLSDLQSALHQGTIERRVETLRRVTDLFLYAASDYSDEQVALFDDVFHCLIQRMEISAKALLSQRLAPVAAAPAGLMSTLALDDVIEVAAPVLSQSKQLTHDILLKTAQTKGQGHLLAITKRDVIAKAITDILIARGNDAVLESTIRNPGAEFSDHGYENLVSRVERNDHLVNRLGMRPLPRRHYLGLVARASAAIRAKLEQENPDSLDEVTSVIKEVSKEASEVLGQETIQARALVQSLQQDGRLNEAQVATFAQNGRLDETSAAIALMTNVPVLTVENMMTEPRAEGLLVLAKIAGLSWATLEKVLLVRRSAMDADEEQNFEEYKENYNLLRISTATQVLRFYRMRESTEQTDPIIN